ncbi:DNA alkylation repair protein [Arthrobacter rhombi]|uniref:DNA alkylation repair enzyme n=1 Tax=Arthrobacter rhombi TaxID=71253 RepID=A0A1R4G7K7_9MICC|nr:DNA alkylation repair protein [Arthrobacter rhombi]SJM64139.1 DNA alkylation repair enzyme [Arthrobacter rhombi]
MADELGQLITSRLAAVADPTAAGAMQRYLKTEMDFFGVRAPTVQRIVREAVRETGVSRWEDLLDEARKLWDGAQCREQWYAAQQLTAYRSCRGRLEFLDLFEDMVVDGAWWDIVDNCHRRFAHLLAHHREQMDPLLRRWAVDPNHWKRRIAIITQLSSKEDTDVGLLEAAIYPNMAEQDFFLRKAIGWALREYAKTDPTWVRSFVASHRSELSGLSQREALKHLRIR